MNPEITLKTITERIFNLIMCFRDNVFQAQSRDLKENNFVGQKNLCKLVWHGIWSVFTPTTVKFGKNHLKFNNSHNLYIKINL